MKLFHFVRSKLSAVTSKLADNDLDTVKAVVNSEIAKGKNHLQTLCIEEARLKQQLVVANESLKQSVEKATQARKELTDKVKQGISEQALKPQAMFVLGRDRLVERRVGVISNIEENIEKIQYMQTDLQLQIAEAEMHLSEIAFGLVIINAKTFRIDVNDKIMSYKSNIEGKEKYLEMTEPSQTYTDEEIKNLFTELKG